MQQQGCASIDGTSTTLPTPPAAFKEKGQT
jgi:hypothetical protein